MATSSEVGISDPARPRTRRWLRRVRISVRALMVIVLVLAVGLGFYVRSVHIQQDAVAAITELGGSLDYDWQWGNYNPDIIDYTGKWRAPRWLARLVPADYVANVVYVSLIPHGAKGSKKADDQTLARVGQLRHLETLALSNSAVTDAGLAHLRGLKGLRELRIDHTAIGDAGLAHLKGMIQLEVLWISGSRITDEGVLDLERALPELTIYRFEEMVTSDNSPRARADLEYARSQPVRLAAALLVDRARFMLGRRDEKESVATVEALCALEADDQLSLIRLAETRAVCIGLLSSFQAPGFPEAERSRLEQLCSDRGIAALRKAIGLGYDNVRRLDGDSREARMLWNLRFHPEFPGLVEEIKAKHPGR